MTAGNASSQNDAASVCMVVAEDKLEELGLQAMGYMRGWAVTGCHPAYMGIGPVGAVPTRSWTSWASRCRTWTSSNSTRPSPPKCCSGAPGVEAPQRR